MFYTAYNRTKQSNQKKQKTNKFIAVCLYLILPLNLSFEELISSKPSGFFMSFLTFKFP